MTSGTLTLQRRRAMRLPRANARSRHPVIGLAVLVAIALIARLAAPTGWMPTRTASGVALMFCSGSAMAQPEQHAMVRMHHAAASPTEDEVPDERRSCAFSIAAAAVVALTDISQDEGGLVLEAALDRRRPQASVGRGLAAPPPPSHAPPAYLA